MNVGDRAQIGNVLLECTDTDQAKATSISDTDHADPATLKLASDGKIHASWNSDSQTRIFGAWENAAEWLAANVFAQADQRRAKELSLRQEFDRLPRYHSGRKSGDTILTHTADGNVTARTINDTASENIKNCQIRKRNPSRLHLGRFSGFLHILG